MSVWKGFHSNPTSSCWDISTKNHKRRPRGGTGSPETLTFLVWEPEDLTGPRWGGVNTFYRHCIYVKAAPVSEVNIKDTPDADIYTPMISV